MKEKRNETLNFLRIVSILLISTLPVMGNAAESTLEAISFQDGSYMTVEITASGARSAGSVTGNKTYTYYDANNVSQWKAVLTGTFTYTGSSATCTSSNVNVTIYDSDWYVNNKSASKSGNVATASVTVGRIYDGTTMTLVPANLCLTCDANGNLS